MLAQQSARCVAVQGSVNLQGTDRRQDSTGKCLGVSAALWFFSSRRSIRDFLFRPFSLPVIDAVSGMHGFSSVGRTRQFIRSGGARPPDILLATPVAARLPELSELSGFRASTPATAADTAVQSCAHDIRSHGQRTDALVHRVIGARNSLPAHPVAAIRSCPMRCTSRCGHQPRHLQVLQPVPEGPPLPRGWDPDCAAAYDIFHLPVLRRCMFCPGQSQTLGTEGKKDLTHRRCIFGLCGSDPNHIPYAWFACTRGSVCHPQTTIHRSGDTPPDSGGTAIAYCVNGL